jgi:hypothetical protein
MTRKTKGFLIIPMAILFSLAILKKPVSSSYYPDFGIHTPVLFSTTLSDTLSLKTFQKLHIQDVEGIKVKYPTGKYACYFEYTADPEVLLDAISSQPFSKYTLLADTRCRAISFDQLKQLKTSVSDFEFENSTTFWTVEEKEFEVYECLKSPLKHTILIDRKSNKVLHRVEYKA